MKIPRVFGAIFAALLPISAGAQVQLISPPQVEKVARAHHCQASTRMLADPDSAEAAPFELRYESKFDPPKALLVTWCEKDPPAPKGTMALVVWAERADNPLRTCPEEIPTASQIGHPKFDGGPMVPHDFVMIDTGERLTVRETRVVFGVRNLRHAESDLFACVAGRWARYSPERK